MQPAPTLGGGSLVAETANLRLSWLSPDDAEDLHRLLSDPAVMRFSATGPLSRQASDAKLQEILGDYVTHGWGRWKVTEKQTGGADTDRFIGVCGLLHWDDIGGQQEVEIGYRYLPTAWRKGYGTEAASAVRDLGFGRFGLRRLISVIEAANVGSWRVAEKVGMRYEKDTDYKGTPVRIYAIENGPRSDTP
jgi:RimJ/RimL family protein N-acetyltransferase